MFCLECGERMETEVYRGQPVYLCYECEVISPVLTKREPRATMDRRGQKAGVSRSLALATY